MRVCVACGSQESSLRQACTKCEDGGKLGEREPCTNTIVTNTFPQLRYFKCRNCGYTWKATV